MVYKMSGTPEPVMATYKDSREEPVLVRQCNTQTYSRLFAAVTRLCAIEDAKLEALSKLFVCSSRHPAPLMSAWPELALTFWAFPPSDDAWSAIQRFLLKTLKPRVYESSETRQAQRELFMVVPLKPLMTSQSLFEHWMDLFAELVGMSSGCVCFSEYFGPQMLSSMLRVDKGRKLTSNFPCQYHKDFSILYSRLANQRASDERVRSVTGMEFTACNFINTSIHNRRLTASVNKLSSDASKWRCLCMRIPQLAQTLDGAHRLSDEAQQKINDIIKQDVTRTDSSPGAQRTLPALPSTTTHTSVNRVVYAPHLYESRSALWSQMMDTFEQNFRNGMQQAPPTAPRAPNDLEVSAPVAATIDTSWTPQQYTELLIDDDRFIYTVAQRATE